MRYLLVTEFFYPHWTGIAKSFLNLATSIADKGYHVDVLTTQHSKKLSKFEIFRGLAVHRAAYQASFSRTQYSATLVLKFCRLVRSCDVVVVNSPCSNVFFIAALGKLFGKQVVIFHQGDLILPRSYGSRFVNYSLERIFDVLTFSAMLFADCVSTYTEDYAKHSRVMRFFPKKFRPLIPRIELPGGTAEASVVERLASLRERSMLVGFAGRFVNEKGFDVLLNAIPLVVEKMPSAHFVFAGQTSMAYEQSFEQMEEQLRGLQSNLTLLGLLGEGELMEFYRSLSAFVLSSRSDCFALTQAEAALFGVPLVVTDIPGARMLVKSSGFGEVVATENPRALANGIIKVLENRHSYNSEFHKVEEFLSAHEQLAVN